MPVCPGSSTVVQKEEAKDVLPQVLRPDSTILVKASRGMKLEELTAKLLELTAEG